MKTKNKILPEQEEEKTFQYRTYGKGELALLYMGRSVIYCIFVR